MSASFSQSEDYIVEVKTEGKEEKPTKYLAIKNDSKQKGGLKPESSSELEDDQGLSYRKLSRIPTTFKFTDKQLNMNRDEYENIFRWFVAVSDKSASSSEFRLLAISCANIKDVTDYMENSSKIHPIEIHNHGFTFVFTININNDNYSINYIDDKKLPNKYGGIVKLFSKKDYITDQKTGKDEQETDKSNKNADEHLLILLTLSGIHKYHMKNISINYVQKLKYPKRIYNAVKNTLNLPFEIFSIDLVYKIILVCIKQCLNKHYFLVDTMKEDIKYIELYNLKTNQLINTFRRPIYYKSVMIDIPNCYAVSNNGKLLAYEYESNKIIKIYSIECSLEIAELVITNSKFVNVTFIDFFHNDEMLFVYSSKNEWSIWNIFGSLRETIKLEDPGFKIELPPNSDFQLFWEIERSNSFMVVNKSDKLAIYDDLIVDKHLKYLKKSNKQDWRKLSKDYFSRKDLDKNIRDLHDKESELDEDNYMLEPWLLTSDLTAPQYSFYLDEKKEKILLIGYHTVQVWYNQGTKKDAKKRILELIYTPLYSLSYFQLSNLSKLREWEYKTIKVKDFKYCVGKFKLSIQIEDAEGSLQTIKIKMKNKDDVISLAKYACHALKYLSVYKKFEQIYDENFKQKLYNVIEQTRNIILRFIRLYPTAWRLLDIRFDLLNVLIEVGDYELVNDILSFGESIHIPQYFPWSGGMNTIRTALSDHTMLACLLEYYSNKAIHNIGWMNTVADIIPELFKSNEEKNEKESYTYYYAQKLFYNPCFCNKHLDLLSFEFLEIIPTSDDLLKVFIPITQLIPQDSELELQEIDYNKIVDIRMVPFADFTTSKRISDIKERKLTKFPKELISPAQYSALKEEDYSPFIKLVIKGERDILYENPSMGAAINWMWYSSKFYWPRTLYILLGFPSYIGLNESSSTYYPFSNILNSIIAVYDWSSISFDSWSFWPLTVISIVGSFVFVMILQNVIISFMSDAFSDAVKYSKHGVYRFQIDLIYDFALLEKSLEFNNLDFKFKDKIRVKYICFYDDPNITKSWKETSDKMKSKPYPKTETLKKSGFESWSVQDCEFIWRKEKEFVDDKGIKYWFFEG
ncbi:7657_t:CDS:2 [Dentiscutata erythropus]|uniref:7657_t:CDS:1 n=1 Tax=Dentiscutata erythropus TaxID=1348616 RepID=A0A9N9D5Q6_9GLOM|nr:7657_t:CDS:2 [Dentiscutata erythropus]